MHMLHESNMYMTRLSITVCYPYCGIMFNKAKAQFEVKRFSFSILFFMRKLKLTLVNNEYTCNHMNWRKLADGNEERKGPITVRMARLVPDIQV